MHLQVKVKIGGTGFPNQTEVNESAGYRRGMFDDLLQVLADNSVNIRGASGRRIEYGGEFSFVAGRAGDSVDLIDEATREAARVLQDNGYDARVFEVSYAFLGDAPGALQAFVKSINGLGLFVEEVLVCTAEPDGTIPVQIYTSRA